MSGGSNDILARIQEIEAEEAENSQYKNYSRYARPTNVRKVTSLQECYNWRKQIIKDCDQTYTKLFETTLSEDDVRNYNDLYNQYMDELNKWDRHIVQDLNGHSFKNKHVTTTARQSRLLKRNSAKSESVDRKSMKKINGKWYVGKALELPEIKDELLGIEALQNQKRAHLNNEAFLKRLNKSLNRKEYFKGAPAGLAVPSDLLDQVALSKEEVEKLKEERRIPDFVIPTMKDMEQWLVNKRKEKLKSVLE
ncbi:hypothetical protein ACO0RG_004730 [Hanseniaspora osmophila]|uniref:Pre-mRNA-splicing factor ISY1 n=1 Tax=Hanseniaspora osmophila TaxID=56408 RepID=A0A1E5RZU2_9ASCO